jgi:hypothetical protein
VEKNEHRDLVIAIALNQNFWRTDYTDRRLQRFDRLANLRFQVSFFLRHEEMMP